MIYTTPEGWIKDSSGIWLPPISTKQLEVFDCYQRFLLVTGPRWSSKTMAIMAKILRHCWENDRAMVAMVSKTIKVSKCVSGETIIQTGTGLKRMRRLVSMKPGGSQKISYPMVGFKGGAAPCFVKTKATMAHALKSKKAIRFKLSGGVEITTSPWHPIWCHDGLGFNYLKASEVSRRISHGDDIWTPSILGNHAGDPCYQTLKFPPSDKRLARCRGICWQIEKAVLKFGPYATVYKLAKETGISSSTIWRYLNRIGNMRGRLKDFSLRLNEDIGYLLGVLIGDGSIGPKHLLSKMPHLTCASQSIIKKVKAVCGRSLPDCKVSKGQRYEWKISSRLLRGLIDHLELSKLSWEKQVPDAIIESPASVIKSFLRGLFDTDGCVTNRGYVSYATTSEELGRDVQQLLLHLGINNRRVFRKNHKRGCWVISIHASARKFFALVGFHCAEKMSRRQLTPATKPGGDVKYPPAIRKTLQRLYRSRYERGYDPSVITKHTRKHLQTIATTQMPGSNALGKFRIYMRAKGDRELNNFHLNGEVTWRKMERAESVMADLFDLTVPETSNFLGNGLINHNSSGVWNDLVDVMLPAWLNGNMGMRLTQAPKVSGDTRLSHFRVSNRFGTESEVQLHSIEYDPEVVSKFKGTRYSMFFFSEADNFKDRIVFDITSDQLRSFTVPEGQRQWIADCNPALEAKEHWLYKLFFDYLDEPDKEDEHFDPDYHSSIRRIEFKLDDNPFITDKEKRILKAKYSYSPTLYARYIEGKWVEDSQGNHFSDTFKAHHILGNINTRLADREIAVPSAACTELILGFDIGDVNHSAHILEKLETQVSEHSPVVTKFVVLDELVSVDQKVTIREFTEAFQEKTNYWKEYILKEYKRKVRWRCWSDSSALIRFRAAAEVHDALIVREVSKGEFVLNSAPKYRNSVRDRVKLTNQLFHEDRLFISANCPNTITALRMLRQGKSVAEYCAPKKYKHPFDSLSYPLASEAPIDLLQNSEVTVGKVPRRLVAA